MRSEAEAAAHRGGGGRRGGAGRDVVRDGILQLHLMTDVLLVEPPRELFVLSQLFRIAGCRLRGPVFLLCDSQQNKNITPKKN